ncbi:plasmid replication protein RepC [Paracoccus sp. SCSIO 75233]|uniref:plasmid replication protein RepC n=1 Tax=Paracoccus sp. SCSIO 75233 TaxID=3017782 RepID=UPI0022F0A61A|nr:plasmid replication protein RepC [Paracoccus sp. SCSIO 75233]WBU55343.1 plasmid replication protein RepC [Paracoccus sp. SCSIO 75233]
MRHISMTPFGRQPVTAGLLATQALSEVPAPDDAPDKWALLRDLTVARLNYGVTDRDLAVLSALLSFHPAKELEDDDRLTVFPSNRALSERAHGMAESTLRRHIAALVRAGLIIRRDSPNGKRYATRDMTGSYDRIFGFDLRPLLVRSPEIAGMALAARQEALRLRRLREEVVIRLRDAGKLLEWALEQSIAVPAALHDAIADQRRRLRRKLDMTALEALAGDAEDILADISAIAGNETRNMDGSDDDNERHYQNSNPDIPCYEPCSEEQKAAGGEAELAIPLGLILKAAPDIKPYAQHPIRNWRDLVSVAGFVRPMLGISTDAWEEACRNMGEVTAAITLACILQRSGEIMRPGGYLRALSRKAAEAGFSPGPMVMALLRAENGRAV